jgi:hypothetical protein
MSVLQLYRGPRLEFIYHRRLGSQQSVALMVDQTIVMRAGPYDMLELLRWMEGEVRTLKEFMREPEDTTQAENLRGDQE